MEVCNLFHPEICFTGRTCPACELYHKARALQVALAMSQGCIECWMPEQEEVLKAGLI